MEADARFMEVATEYSDLSKQMMKKARTEDSNRADFLDNPTKYFEAAPVDQTLTVIPFASKKALFNFMLDLFVRDMGKEFNVAEDCYYMADTLNDREEI